MNPLHEFLSNTLNPKPKAKRKVTSKPTKLQKPKTKKPKAVVQPKPKPTPTNTSKHKCVEFTALTVDGLGDRCAGVVLDTLQAPKFKNPTIYVVLVCKVNNLARYNQSYIKHINACYCVPTRLDTDKIPKHKLVYNKENKKGA